MNIGHTRSTARRGLAFALALLTIPLMAQQNATNTTTAVPVTVKTFDRAESDMYFGRAIKLGAFGKFYHYRTPTPIEKQEVVKMNRETLYSTAVFDLDAGLVTVTLPDVGKRFLSMLVINEDHYAPLEVAYAPARVTLTRKECETRYIMVAIRTFADFDSPADVKAANAMQDKIQVQQASAGKFEVPSWDPTSQGMIRGHLAALQSVSGATTERRMGRKEDVDQILHIMATATGWGLNPPEAAVYNNVYPKANDGKTVHRLTVKDVPVDGFWSIRVYNEKNYFEKNDLNSYSISSVTAKPNPDGSYTIQFGGCTKGKVNCLVIPPKWSYQVRQYRPRKAIIDGTWVFPVAQPVG